MKMKILALPGLLWVLLFFVAPLLILIAISFCTKGTYGGIVFQLSFASYVRTWDPLYLGIILDSIKLAAITTLSCLILGLPLAYVIARSSVRLRNLLLGLLLVPFFTNFLVRAYALRSLFGVTGPFTWLTTAAPGETVLISSGVVVWVGMITNYLPFMVLPLIVSLQKFDFRLMDAARDLGATRMRAIFGTLIPLNMRGILSGSMLVFTPALGEYLIPDFLGGARTILMGNLLVEQFLKARDWPFGSALVIQLGFCVMMISLGVRALARSKFHYDEAIKS